MKQNMINGLGLVGIALTAAGIMTTTTQYSLSWTLLFLSTAVLLGSGLAEMFNIKKKG